MNTYLFTGWYTSYDKGRFVDSCSSLILAGFEERGALDHFQQCLLVPREGDQSIPSRIQKLVFAPVLDHVLTENGPAPLNWDQLADEAAQYLEGAPLDNSEQGYWVDCNQCLDLDKLPTSVDSLQRELPEDIGSGLNWKFDRNYLFVVHVLSPPKPVSEVADETESLGPRSEPQTDEDAATLADAEPDQKRAPFPDLVDKELAVLVRARNAVVAAWLWRRHAKSSNLARNDIQISPWIMAIVLGPDGFPRAAGEDTRE